MNQKQYEQRALIVGIISNILMGGAGVWVYHITKIEALFLDAYFTLLAVLSGIAATIISKKSKNTSKSFPHGYFFMEPLYAILKSLLTLALLVYATISVTVKAMDYFLYGTGEIMNYGPVIPYEILMVILCTALSFFYWKQNKRTNNTSTMLSAEAKATLIDGIMSGGIGIGILIISFISKGSTGGGNGESPFSFLLYTGDFFITIILAVFSVKEPFKVMKEAFIEFANGIVTKDEIKTPIERTVKKYLLNNTELKNCYIHKVGMSFRVFIHLDSQSDIINKDELLKKTICIEKELSHEYENVSVSFIFP
ncbi:cation transporter [Kineothrix sedimenti]|uniref:Cation transporter n=1 Tax=Kineothrix sedimenti TaxID=3123317 RepID=A0ABZ3EWT5_9FIRM